MINKEARKRIAFRSIVEKNKIFKAIPYFPEIKPDHGSTHNSCIVKNCRYKEDHFQDPVEAAEQWLVKNGKIS